MGISIVSNLLTETIFTSQTLSVAPAAMTCMNAKDAEETIVLHASAKMADETDIHLRGQKLLDASWMLRLFLLSYVLVSPICGKCCARRCDFFSFTQISCQTT